LAVNRIRDSEVDTTLFQSDILFEKGVPQRNFRIEDQSHILVGRLLRNGLAHDEWSLYAGDGVGEGERWYFKEGLLQGVQVGDNDEPLDFTFPVWQSEKVRTVDLDRHYLDALQLCVSNWDAARLKKSHIARLLDKNAAFYHKINTLLAQLGNASFKPGFRAKLPYYALDTLELKELDSIAGHYQKARAMGDSILENTQLNMLKLSDSEALFLHKVVSVLSKDFLEPLTHLIQFREQDILEVVPRSELLRHLWPNGEPPTTIEVSIPQDSVSEKRTFVLPHTKPFAFQENGLGPMRRMAQYAHRSIDSIARILDKKLIQEIRQQKRVALEEKLIRQGTGLQQLLDSLGQAAPPMNLRALEQIRNLVDTELSVYAGNNGTTDKAKRAKELIYCQTRLALLATLIGQLPEQGEEIRQKYQDAVWNPFMATVMDEEVKKRITAAYTKIIIPYLLNEVDSGLNCDTVDKYIALFEKTYLRMLLLREEDSAKLERKLRKEDDPLTVMKLFGITPIQKGK
ncbi:MAG: hypothetical protein AAGA86_15015, partial [Bacteroidota bacterium]